MVHFFNPRLGATGRLTVCSALASNGYRVIIKYPGNLRRVHHFPDDKSLHQGTIRIQTALTREGWQPCGLNSGSGLNHFTRKQHFPRFARI